MGREVARRGVVTLARHSKGARPRIHRHSPLPKRLTRVLGLRAGRWDQARKSKGSSAKEPYVAKNAVGTRQKKP